MYSHVLYIIIIIIIIIIINYLIRLSPQFFAAYFPVLSLRLNLVSGGAYIAI
jgi:hypothetical protein